MASQIGNGHNWCSPYKQWQAQYMNDPFAILENQVTFLILIIIESKDGENRSIPFDIDLTLDFYTGMINAKGGTDTIVEQGVENLAEAKKNVLGGEVALWTEQADGFSVMSRWQRQRYKPQRQRPDKEKYKYNNMLQTMTVAVTRKNNKTCPLH